MTRLTSKCAKILIFFNGFFTNNAFCFALVKRATIFCVHITHTEMLYTPWLPLYIPLFVIVCQGFPSRYDINFIMSLPYSE